MPAPGPKAVLHDYLRTARASVLWKLDGLSAYDVRRPLTPTGTNLLGLVKHLSIVEVCYVGTAFDRPFTEHLPWWDEGAEDNIDAWATEDETRAEIVDRYQRATAHADVTIEIHDLDAAGTVPFWPGGPDVTLHEMLVHVLAETTRHAGHADILREQIDGAVGLGPGNACVPEQDDAWWQTYRDRIERAARTDGPGEG